MLREDHDLKYDDDKLIQHIIYNVKPKCYETLIQMLKRDLAKKLPVSLEETKEEFRQAYGQVKKDKTPETALITKQFKGNCRICGG